MAKRVQLRRGTTADHSAFVGALGEVTVDTEKKTLKVHDGATAGGIEVRTFAVAGDFYSQFVPLPYPQATPPSGYLAMMGQAISQATYPILYSLYGARLPDLRGEFIRGWDNGRGADAGRSILSWQQDAIRNITGTIGAEGLSRDIGSVEATGSFYYLGRNYPAYGGAGYWGSVVFAFDASRQVPTAADNRPRNVAFNYIVKAG